MEFYIQRKMEETLSKSYHCPYIFSLLLSFLFQTGIHVLQIMMPGYSASSKSCSLLSLSFRKSPHKSPQENGQLSRVYSPKVPYPPQELEQTTKNEAIPGHSLFISCGYVSRRWWEGLAISSSLKDIWMTVENAVLSDSAIAPLLSWMSCLKTGWSYG